MKNKAFPVFGLNKKIITFETILAAFIGLYARKEFESFKRKMLNTMKKAFFLAWMFCALYASAQKADFESCRKYSADSLKAYYHSLTVFPNWIPGTEMFWYSYTTTNGIKYYLVNPVKRKKQELFSTEEMAARLTEETGTVFEGRTLRVGGFVFQKGDPWRFTFSKSGKDFCYDVRKRELKVIPPSRKEERRPMAGKGVRCFSPDSNYAVYAYRSNLYLLEKGDSLPVQLTTDGEKSYSYDNLKEKESDAEVSPNIVWTGNSRVFYALRQDRRRVKDCWVIDHLAQPRPRLRTYKFPMPGEQNVFTYDLHLFYPKTRRHVVVDIAKYPDQEVKMVASDLKHYPDDLYFTRKSRTCDRMDLCRVDTRTGEVSEVISEVSEPYFTEQLFDCRILNGGEDIVWWSERSGKGHFYLYDRTGKLKNAITSGDFVACRMSRVDAEKRWFVFEGYGRESGSDPNYRFYYRVNFDGSGLTLLTPGDGYHSLEGAKEAGFWVDTYSRMDKVPVTVLRDMKGREVMKLEEADLTALVATGWKMPERIRVKAADGETGLYGVMYKPFSMEPGRKYPIIACVYPGPQEDQVPLAFTVDDSYNQSLAQLGFVVVSIGYRGGNMFRGKAFYTFGYGNLRDYALADCKAAIEQLGAAYPFIDLERVGIYGHSGGGFMSAAALMTYPDFFKVAVAASGNHDNNIYTKWWGEMYHGVKMRTKEDGNGEKSYIFESKIPTNMELVKNLRGKLLLITGDVDINVHPANTFRLANALIEAGKRFDMMVIPGADHGIDSPYYFYLLRDYFAEHLLGVYPEGADM